MEDQKITRNAATRRIIVLALEVAEHLGHIPTVLADYDPTLDPDVLGFIEQAVQDSLRSEQQQVRELDRLDKELP